MEKDGRLERFKRLDKKNTKRNEEKLLIYNNETLSTKHHEKKLDTQEGFDSYLSSLFQ